MTIRPPHKIGLFREWTQGGTVIDGRTPLVPEHLEQLIKQGVGIVVQESNQRGFRRQEYLERHIPVVKSLSDCSIFLSRRTPSPTSVERGKTYLFMSHDIKGQPYFPATHAVLQTRQCQLINFKRIVDERGKRMVSFGDYVGAVAMIEVMWALGQRLAFEGVFPNPFMEIKQAGEGEYGGMEAAIQAFQKLGEKIHSEGLPESLSPFICGFAGAGNDGGGAIRMFGHLNPQDIKARDLKGDIHYGDFSRYQAYRLILEREDRARPINPDSQFDRTDFDHHPENYTSAMAEFLPHLTLFMNAIYWDERFPRLITNPMLRRLFAAGEKPRLKVIGDMTDAVNGSIDCIVQLTSKEMPVYTYDPFTRDTPAGVEGAGVIIMAIDRLLSMMPRESSEFFSRGLYPLIPALAQADFSLEFESDKLSLPEPLRKAVVLWHGKEVGNLQYV